MSSTRPVTFALRWRTIASSALLLAVLVSPSPVVAHGNVPVVAHGNVMASQASTVTPPSQAERSSASTDRIDDGLLLDGVGAGLPSDGTPSRPTRDVRAILRTQSDATGTSGSLRTTAFPAFATLGYVQQSVPRAAHPYALASAVPIDDTGIHDADGVRMIRIGTTLFDHPVAQAQYGLANVASFDLTDDQRFLDRAIAQATRLVDDKVVSRGAWYFPYPFDFALHGRATETLRAPWYSAMAQGMALSLFVDLYERTNDDAWLAAATGTVASFRNGPQAGMPWVTHIDDAGYLWLEEYPADPPNTSDFTLNGHMFATFGLFDYATLTGDPLTTLLFDGGVTTARRYGGAFAPDGFRTQAWLSAYCLRHHVLDVKYHSIVTNQFIAVHSVTADALFARVSDAYRADYPEGLRSTVRFAAGTWTGYVFDSKGRIVRSKAVRFSRASTAPSDRYTRIKGRGLYYHITAGSLKGYWIAERAERVHATGQYETARYYPSRTAVFPVGRTVGYRFDANGIRNTSRSVSLSAKSSAPFDQTAMFGGRRYTRINAGTLTGYWVPTAAVTLR
jgi:D-glucuronyl C5-epimerase-like protein